MLFDVYEHILDDVLNTLCSLPYPMPSRLRDTVHLAYQTSFQLDAGLDLQHRMWFEHADRDLRAVLDLLDDLGAIERDRGMPDPGFTGSDPRVRWVVKVLAEQGIDPRTNEVAAIKALRAAQPGFSLVAATALARETKLSQAV